MQRMLAAFALSSLLVGCSKEDSPPAGGGAAPVAEGQPAEKAAAPAAGGAAAGGDLAGELAKIKTATAAAKTSEDFLKITADCGGLEIKAAMSGQQLGSNADFKAACKVEPAKAKAKVAIAESTPDKMSALCLSASMALEDLANEGVEKAEMEKLNADVKKACKM